MRPAELRERPWRDARLPPEVSRVPTMLSEQEQGLLYWLAENYYTGNGRIVDAGCFLGGSTVALAAGLSARTDTPSLPPIVVYDSFTTPPEQAYRPFGLSPGQDFRAMFERNLSCMRDVLEVHAGDITDQEWSGEPIEVLFLDILKTWSINDWVLSAFWPSLVEGSIVVQQDYQYGGHPWILITMELLGDCFERLDEMPNGSVVFLLKHSLPDLREMGPTVELPVGQKIELVERALARETTNRGEGMLRISKAKLLMDLGEWRRAELELNRIVWRYFDDASVVDAAKAHGGPELEATRLARSRGRIALSSARRVKRRVGRCRIARSSDSG